MKDSTLHDQLQSFPKNHKLKEEALSKISGSIDRELKERQAKFQTGTLFNKKVIATGFVTLAMAAILIWSIGGQGMTIQKQAGIHHDKELTMENKQNPSVQEEISPEDIYSVSQSENSWAVDPREPRNLMTDGGSVVHLKVQSVGEAVILPKYEDFYTYEPFTPLEVEIVDTISGKALSGRKTIYIGGGNIRIANLLDSWVGNEYEGFEKMGLTKMSQEEQERQFISYTSEYDYKMEPGKEYAVILVRKTSEAQLYGVMGQGYGIFEIEETGQGDKIYRNVLTGKTSKLDF
ncbi:hypothetical protein ACFVAD_17960 [Sutcliffiella sp. NPDC057660]|uniref:hypothetical protein n=1 Tax=Sutcliffiella sp. NPDC057660 TaxID=3346199 RepID=UPI0036806D94